MEILLKLGAYAVFSVIFFLILAWPNNDKRKRF